MALVGFRSGFCNQNTKGCLMIKDRFSENLKSLISDD